MSIKTISAIMGFAIATAAGSSFAASGHDAYDRALLGKTGMTHETGDSGKAAYAAPSGSAWSGHEAYRMAFYGERPSPAGSDAGKAAYSGASGIDGNASYHKAFIGD